MEVEVYARFFSPRRFPYCLVCVLKANELKVYIFTAETDPSPERTVFLDDLTVVGECKEARAAYYGFTVRSRDRTYQFCTESPKERDSTASIFLKH